MKKLFLVLVSLSSFGALADTSLDGIYTIKCTNSVADGGQLNASGKLTVTNGIATGKLKTQLRVYTDDVDAPEAEVHTYPTLALSGPVVMAASTFPDGRPMRPEMHLTATNWSVKSLLTGIDLVDNRPLSPDSDAEESELQFEGRRFSAVCTFKRKF